MRKITSILSMFLLIAGWNTASAQFAFKKLKAVGDRVTDVSQLVDGHYYVFKGSNLGKYIKLDKETMQFKNDNQLTEEDNSDGLAVFKLHVDESTGTKLYSFESARGGYYMPKVGVGTTAYATETTSPAKFVISATDKNGGTKDNCWAIKNSSDNAYFDMQPEQFVGWYGTESNTWYEISEVTVSEEKTDLQIVYKVVEKTNGTVFSTAYGIAKSGDTYSYTAPANTSYYLTLTKEPENKTITESNMTFEYEYTGTAPFNVGQWYSLRIKHDDRVLRAIAEENNLYVNTEPNSNLEAIANTYPNFLNALWRIEESGTGVKIYNKAVGKYLQANGYSQSGISNRATFDNTGTVFYVKSFNGGLGFYTGSDYLNASCTSSTGANTRLGVWNANGDGSTFYCEKTKDELLALGKTAFDNTPDVYSYTSNNALIKGGIYSGNKSSAATTLDELFEIGAKVLSEVCPDPNVYYLIRNVNGGELGRGSYTDATDGNKTIDPENDRYKYLSTSHMTCNTNGQNVSDQTLKRVKGKSDLLPLLWKFVKVEGQDGQYYLQNANMKACVNFNVVPTAANEVTQKTAFTFEATNTAYNNWQFYATNDGVSMFLMKTADGAKCLNAQSGAKAEGVADYANHNADAGNYWQFVKVTDVPLTIAANDYTTLCLPFNVQLPEGSAVKAYYASAAAGDVLKLTEITGGIIPANQGVILQNTNKSEVANINLTITPEETTTLTGNQLVGVTAKREGYTAKQNYVLANGNKGIGFYKANFTAVTANKAYLPVANVQNAQGVMMAFSFGDEVTGIDNVKAAAPAAKKYYDLQGRRVLYPAKGIFVTEDGQKVLFK